MTGKCLPAPTVESGCNFCDDKLGSLASKALKATYKMVQVAMGVHSEAVVGEIESGCNFCDDALFQGTGSRKTKVAMSGLGFTDSIGAEEGCNCMYLVWVSQSHLCNLSPVLRCLVCDDEQGLGKSLPLALALGSQG
jgi:hypothetical protein